MANEIERLRKLVRVQAVSKGSKERPWFASEVLRAGVEVLSEQLAAGTYRPGERLSEIPIVSIEKPGPAALVCDECSVIVGSEDFKTCDRGDCPYPF